jgi:hypothetical protein
MYLSGGSRGLTYLRYENPEMRKRSLLSMTQVIKTDATVRGQDPHEAFRQWVLENGQLIREKSVAPKERPQRCVIQKGLYSQNGSYHVSLNWLYLTISSKKTTKLEDAVDWHIALSQLRERAKRRVQAHIGDSPAPPLTQEELLQLIRSEPDLIMTLTSNFHRGMLRNIHTPSFVDYDFESHMQVHQRFATLLESTTNKAIFDEERKKVCVEGARKVKVRLQICRELAVAIDKRIKTVGKVALPAPLSPPKLPIQTCQSAPSAPKQSRSASSGPSPHVAIELQRSLRLNDAEALALAQAARRLPAAELTRICAEIRAGVVALPDTTPPRRPKGRPPAMDQHSRIVLAQPTRSEMRVKRSNTSSQLALQESPATMPETRCSEASSSDTPQLRLFDSVWFPGIEAGSSQSSFFSILDVCNLRLVSSKAASAGQVEMRSRLSKFEYTSCVIAAPPRKSRTGRILHSTSSQHARLVRFLTQRTHLGLFEDLRLACAPIEALEDTGFLKALKRMPRLRHIQIPANGWSTPATKRQLVNALPSVVYHRFC